MKLTRREKLLIGILVVLIAGFAGWKFLLNPALQEKMDLESSIEDLSLRKAQVEEIASEADTIKQNLKDAYSEMNTESFFYHGLTSAQADRLLSAFAKAHSVTISEMTISEPEVVGLDGFIPNIAPLFSSFREQRIKFDQQATEKYLSDAAGLPDTETDESVITIPLCRCVLAVSGKAADVAAMVDEINSAGRSIYVSGFGDQITGNIENGIYEDSIYVNIYFLED